MAEQHEVLEALERTRALDLIRWASSTNFARVNKDYDEDAGHDQSVVGVHGYKYFIDLFGRATATGRFALPDGETIREGRDVLRVGISEEAFNAMPRLEPGQVVRSDFNHSPGWACDGIRWLLQSFPFGAIDDIDWSRKSESKRTVALQSFDDADGALFGYEEMGLDTPPIDSFDGITLVLAHSFNRDTGAFEVFVGQSRVANHREESPWHWRHLVAQGGPGNGSRTTIPGTPALPGTPPSQTADDAHVRLRTQPDQTSGTKKLEANE